jgi:hypothetical protein
MIAAIDYELNQIEDESKKESACKSWGQEDQFFVSRLLDMNKKKLIQSKLATREATLAFSGIGSYVNDSVLVISGTLPSVTFDDRDKFIALCPELKMVYPALHDPNCFGATPNGEKCAMNICALKVPRRRGGC